MHAEKYLRKSGDKPDHPRVLLTAHTGKASSLIGKSIHCIVYVCIPKSEVWHIFSGGQTVHGAFGFSYGDEQQTDNTKCGDKKRDELRENLSELKLLIIDEVSLISSDMLYKLDARLKEIFHLKKKIPFGGVSVMTWITSEDVTSHQLSSSIFDTTSLYFGCDLLALPQLMTTSDIFSVKWPANQIIASNTLTNHSSPSSRLLRKQRIFGLESRSGVIL